MAAPLTDLLAQATAPTEPTESSLTLTDTLRKHARQLTDADLLILVAGLREQRTRWNAAQATGSRERISSSRVSREAAPKALPPQAPTGFKIKVRPKPVL